MAAINPSSVHHQETTADSAANATYQWHQRQFCTDEWYAAEQLYAEIPLQTKIPYSEQLADCRTSAWFLRHRESGELRIASNSCRLRWCPLCSHARQNYITWQVKEWVQSARRPKFLTFTLKHSEAPLKQQVTSLYRYFRKIRSHRLIVRNAKGGIWFFHIKRSRDDGLWHPHIHAVVEGNFIPQSALKHAWKKITGSSSIVDIRPCRNPRKTANDIARYSSRPADLSKHVPPDRLELWWAMHGRRLCGAWGSARAVSLRQPKSDERHMWEKVGTFSDVISKEDFNAFAKDIIRAWRTNTPLPEGIHVLRDVAKEQYDYEHRKGKWHIDPKRCEEQPTLF